MWKDLMLTVVQKQLWAFSKSALESIILPKWMKVSLKAFRPACSEMKTKTITHGKDQYPTHGWLILSGCSAFENLLLTGERLVPIAKCPWIESFAFSQSQGAPLQNRELDYDHWGPTLSSNDKWQKWSNACNCMGLNIAYIYTHTPSLTVHPPSRTRTRSVKMYCLPDAKHTSGHWG